MFDLISDKLQKAFASLTSKGLLTETDVDAALRDLRVALLEADVALPAIKHLVAQVRERAVGEAVLKGVNPGQQVVKIVYDCMVDLLGGAAVSLNPLELRAMPPAVVLMCGLQGGGKTTTTGKLAKWLKEKQGKTVYLASLDIYRPAAIEQLSMLAEHAGVLCLQTESRNVAERVKLAIAEAKKANADVLMLDTACRTVLDDDMMAELKAVAALATPAATLLVADAQTGQSAVEVAQAFHAQVPLTGLVLTRMDGDARGGAALSMRYVTGVPLLFMGLGEKIDALDVFRAEGVAGRILGQGDVVALVNKVQAAANQEDSAKLEQKFLSGKPLDMDDMKKQLVMMKKLGGMSGIMDLLPGMGAIKDKLGGVKMDEKVFRRQIAVIESMTPAERKNTLLLNAKRRIRIAKGAGVEVADVNKLVKMHEGMNKMAKMMRSGAFAKMLRK